MIQFINKYLHGSILEGVWIPSQYLICRMPNRQLWVLSNWYPHQQIRIRKLARKIIQITTSFNHCTMTKEPWNQKRFGGRMFRCWDLLYEVELQTCAQPGNEESEKQKKNFRWSKCLLLALVSSKETSREEAELGIMATLGVIALKPSLLSILKRILLWFDGDFRIEFTSDNGYPFLVQLFICSYVFVFFFVYQKIDDIHLLLVQLLPREMLGHTCLSAALQAICLRDVPVFSHW